MADFGLCRNWTNHPRSLRAVTSLRSGPVRRPPPIVWQLVQFCLKNAAASCAHVIVLPHSMADNTATTRALRECRIGLVSEFISGLQQRAGSRRGVRVPPGGDHAGPAQIAG